MATPTRSGSCDLIKEECLDRVIPCGNGHLRRTIAEYVEHRKVSRIERDADIVGHKRSHRRSQHQGTQLERTC